MEGYHSPVLLKEVLGYLDLKKDKASWYVDATLGDGGYSVEILKAGGKIIGIDVDPVALGRAGARFKELGNLVEDEDYKLVTGNFRDLKELVLQTDIKSIIFDLGVSSLQLDSPERGFSFQRLGPLDMRMDPNLAVSAADLVAVLSKEELYELFQKFGEEQNAFRYAKALVRARELNGNLTTTEDLARAIERVAGRRGKIHPATKVFQALRIVVNDELNALTEALPQALGLLKKDGNLLVISFHSLEDRIVKNTFREWEDEDLGTILTKKPIEATEEEVSENPRSRSAKMRVFKKG